MINNGCHPNILVIMTDQQRYDQLGFASNSYFETPNLDLLAANGLIFNNAYTSATVCIPARGAILSGLRPGRFRTQGKGNALKEGSWTFPHYLRNQGYQTALVGKMHLEPIRARHGFEIMRTAEHLGLVYGPEEFDDYTKWLVSQGKGDWKATHIFGKEEAAEKQNFRDNYQAVPFHYDKEYHPTSWITRESIRFLEQRDHNRPFMLITSFPHPHSPFDPPKPYSELYDIDDARLPVYDPEINSQLPPAAKSLMYDANNLGHAAVSKMGIDLQKKVSTYIRALIKQIDDAIGEILKKIDLADTVVIFTTDHGDYYGRRGLMLKTPGIPFDDIARVPLIISGASVGSGLISDNLVQNSDIAMTVMDIAGIKPVRTEQFDSCSLYPYFNGRMPANDRTVFCWSNYDWHMIRYTSLKYFYHAPSGQEMLFDVTADPAEKYNLTDDVKYFQDLRMMRSKMEAELPENLKP